MSCAVFCHTRTARDVTEVSPPANITLTFPADDGSVVGALHVTVDAHPARVTHTVVAADGAHQAVDTLLLTGGTKPALLAAGKHNNTIKAPRQNSILFNDKW